MAHPGVLASRVAPALLFLGWSRLTLGILEALGIEGELSTMAAQHQSHDEALRRVQGEYIEMPGLRLTPAQAQRLWGLDRAACDALLGALVDAKFLLKTRDGAFMRSDQTRAAVG